MKQRPNILVIMADQFRTKSMTGLGDGIETPNIDRIRERSMFFSKAACTAPICTPSRASLATGKMPSRCGVTVHDANLPKDQVTYYQLLRKAGYRVAVAGKTDLHKMDNTVGRNGPLPIGYHLGFTNPEGETEGKMNSAWYDEDESGNIIPRGPYQRFLLSRDPEKLRQLRRDYVSYLRKQPKYHAEATPLDADETIDVLTGNLACDFLREVDDEAPWHLFVSFPGPHNPWDPPKEEVDALGEKEYPPTPSDPMVEKPDWICKRAQKEGDGLTPERLTNTKRHYDAAIQVIDKQIGCILDLLEQRGLAENTVVIFTADHGELMGEHQMFAKANMYEGALRIPLLVHLPGMETGSESRELATLMDLAPTILELCDVNYNKEDMDARSLLPVLAGEHVPLREVQHSELFHSHMVFDGRYKWIRNFNDLDELYDLENDPHEFQNLIHQLPEVLARLKQHAFRH